MVECSQPQRRGEMWASVGFTTIDDCGRWLVAIQFVCLQDNIRGYVLRSCIVRRRVFRNPGLLVSFPEMLAFLLGQELGKHRV
jgi:hypothetical protein